MRDVPAGRLVLPWGGETITLDLPPTWGPVEVRDPSDVPAVPDVRDEVRRALAEPIGSLHLRTLAKHARRVAIVIDDASRPTPVASLLPPVLEELGRAGVALTQVTVVVALGLHRPMTEDEFVARVGPAQAERLRWENHGVDDPARLVSLGVTRAGTPVVINRTVAESDLVVSIGCIEPHIIAGFGGGAKNIVPGVAGRLTIGRNHSLNCTPDTVAMTGQAIDRNPMRLDLEEAAGMLRPAVFIVNAVLNGVLKVVRVVAGDPVSAHRAGCDACARVYAVPVATRVDVVITDSHPLDLDLRQGVKALANAVPAVRRGGVILTLARATEGTGVMASAGRKLPLRGTPLRLLAPLLAALVRRVHLRGTGEEERFLLYFALQAMRRARLLLYAPSVPPEARRALPFIEFVDSPAEGIARAVQLAGPHARALVLPHGGVSYPLVG